ncbi:MAG: hypothetical protein ACFCUX_04380 [Candidatus Methylacidiphilales bacterium]
MPSLKRPVRFTAARAFFMSAAILLNVTGAIGWAQDEEKVREWKARFEKGRLMAEQDRVAEALEIFSAILLEDPQARGSLLMSGLCYNRLHAYESAVPFFERFLKLQPDHVSGTLGAIKALQSSGRTDRAEALIETLYRLRDEGTDPRLKAMLSFEREAVPQANQTSVSILQSFPDHKGYAWRILVLDVSGKRITRQVEWKEGGNMERQMMELQPDESLWILGETIFNADLEVKDYKIHQIMRRKPDYPSAVKAALDILSQVD